MRSFMLSSKAVRHWYPQVLAVDICRSRFIISTYFVVLTRLHFLATSRRTLNMYCERAVVVQGNHFVQILHARKKCVTLFPFFCHHWLLVAALLDGETNGRSVYTFISSPPYGNV